MKNLEKQLLLNKSGVSAVIATVLLILLTVAAAAIIGSFVLPFTKKSLDETNCVHFMNYFEFDDDFGLLCYENGLHGATVKVKDSRSNGRLAGFDLTFSSDSDFRKINVREGMQESCETDGVRGLESSCSTLGSLPISGKGEYTTFTYVYNSGGLNFNKVEIYPVMDDESICDLSDSVTLRPCSPSGKLEST